MSGTRERVQAAFAAVPRADFLPADQVELAGQDVPLPIGHRATSSQPSTVAAMLELLDAGPGHRVLDVGAGSGWTTALLAHLVGSAGRVEGVEIEPDLVADARRRLTRSGLGWARIHLAPAGEPGRLGRPEDAPYDRVLVSATARHLPEQLTDQLADGGRLVIPVRSRMLVVTREGDRLHQHKAPGAYRFVPLR